MNICLIPARAGSKRIPDKNFKDFLGKPIIQYPIDIAVKSGCFDKIIIATDKKNIKDIVNTKECEVYFRKEENAHDKSTIYDVFKEVNEIYSSEDCCIVYPTSVFFETTDLLEAFKYIQINYKYKSCASFVKLKNEFEFYKVDDELKPCGRVDKNLNHNSSKYKFAGQFIYFKTNEIKNTPFIEPIKPIFYSEMTSQDIDTQNDWDLAELKYRRLYDI